MIAFVVLCVLTPVTCVSVINCVDSETQSILPWRSSIAHTIKVVNGTRVFDYEGPSTSGNFELKFGEKLRVLGGERAYLFVEFVNESPRRLTVQPVKNEKGIDFVLLPGISGNGVQDSVEEIDTTAVGEPSITGILRKPQHVMIRKLVIFKLRSNDREPVTTVVSQLRANSCKMTTSPEPKSSPISSSPTQPPKPRVCSTATKSTEPTTCPECKCVCNCNCNPEC